MDPLSFWREEGESSLHWFDADGRAWLYRPRGSQLWRGWAAERLEPIERAHWVPWPGGVCDESEAPFVRWYCGGLTNAAFNEVLRAAPSPRPNNILDGPLTPSLWMRRSSTGTFSQATGEKRLLSSSRGETRRLRESAGESCSLSR